MNEIPSPEEKNESPEYSVENKVQRASEQIWGNLMSSGLAKQIILNSGHANKQGCEGIGKAFEVKDIAYDGVNFQYSMSTRCGVYIDVAILSKPNIPGQPVIPKIYRISENKEDLAKMTETIWQNVSEEEMFAIISAAIQYQKEKNEARINDRQAREHDPENTYNVRDAEKNIDALNNLEAKIAEGLKPHFDTEYGALVIDSYEE